MKYTILPGLAIIAAGTLFTAAIFTIVLGLSTDRPIRLFQKPEVRHEQTLVPMPYVEERRIVVIRSCA